jgi:hypothetical protein
MNITTMGIVKRINIYAVVAVIVASFLVPVFTASTAKADAADDMLKKAATVWRFRKGLRFSALNRKEMSGLAYAPPPWSRRPSWR